jgi:hypothetical protein
VLLGLIGFSTSAFRVPISGCLWAGRRGQGHREDGRKTHLNVANRQYFSVFLIFSESLFGHALMGLAL